MFQHVDVDSTFVFQVHTFSILISDANFTDLSSLVFPLGSYFMLFQLILEVLHIFVIYVGIN